MIDAVRGLLKDTASAASPLKTTFVIQQTNVYQAFNAMLQGASTPAASASRYPTLYSSELSQESE